MIVLSHSGSGRRVAKDKLTRDGYKVYYMDIEHWTNSTYVDGIRRLHSSGEYDVILAPSYPRIIHGLVKLGLSYTLIYPHLSLKEVYLNRARARGSHEALISVMSGLFKDQVDLYDGLSSRLVNTICLINPDVYVYDVVSGILDNRKKK